MRLFAAASLCAGLAALVAPRPAEACSCAQHDPIVFPSGTGVPLNAVVMVVTDQPFQTIELRDSTGVDVPGSISNHERLPSDQIRIFRPDAPLAAGTGYDVLVGGAVAGAFTTGDAEDTEAPPAIEVGTLTALEWIRPLDCADTCAGAIGTALTVTAGASPADAAVLAYQIEVAGEAPRVIMARPFPWGDGEHYGGVGCQPALPTVDAGDSLCVTPIVWDVAGNETLGAQACLTVPLCELAVCELPAAEDGCPAPPPGQDGCAVGTGATRAPRGGGAGLVLAALAVVLAANRRRG